jgi:hypothetical protein
MSNIPGGWTDWNFAISKEAQQVFDAAVKGLLGVQYTPLAFATQVVAGTNYCFLSKAKVVHPIAPERVVKLYIFQPLPTAPETKPHITEIVEVKP